MKYALSHVTSGDHAGLAAYFARLIERLAGGGAGIAAISAITPHICIRELEKITPLPLVNIIDEVAAEIRARGYRRVALFGTRYVVESRMFGGMPGFSRSLSSEQMWQVSLLLSNADKLSPSVLISLQEPLCQ
jgi:hypothetical protein